MKKKIDELIFKEDTAWDFLIELLEESSNSFHVLKPNVHTRTEILLSLQVTNKSTMGAIIFETGGILIEDGWLKILGSGNEKICGDILSWNGLSETNVKNVIEGALIVAYDVVGGFFAINGGAFDGLIKQMYYFAPDTLEWESMDMGYTDFIGWVLNGDLSLFYESFRWDGWEEDLLSLKGDEAFTFFPFLWTKQGSDMTKIHKSSASVEEVWNLQQDFLRQ